MLTIIKNEEHLENSLSAMHPEEILKFQDKLWHYAIWKGRTENPDFSRRDLTKHMQPCTDYMYRVGCTFDSAYCRAKICYKTNPNCAVKKTKAVIRTLRKIVLKKP